MKNPQRLFVLLIFAGLITLPLACTKGFEVSPASPGPAVTATETFQFSPTSTSTVNPAFTATDTPTVTSSPTPSFTATITPTLVDINFNSGVTVLPTGAYQFGCVHIGTGATVTIQGAVTVYCTCFTLDAGATITGVGTGYVPNNLYVNPGPGHGQDDGNGSCSALCTGAGHGGQGSTYCFSTTLFGSSSPLTCCATGAGKAYDDPIHPSYMGSAGGWPIDYTNGGFCFTCNARTSCGGGLLKIVVLNPATNTLQPATINGTIDMSGASGGQVGADAEFSGCGSGGTILVESSVLAGSGVLNANGGGQGFSFPPTLGIDNGGGGGGIISLISDSSSFSGATSVLKGDNAHPGIVSKTAPPSSGY